MPQYVITGTREIPFQSVIRANCIGEAEDRAKYEQDPYEEGAVWIDQIIETDDEYDTTE